jgi:hypothetical protein
MKVRLLLDMKWLNVLPEARMWNLRVLFLEKNSIFQTCPSLSWITSVAESHTSYVSNTLKIIDLTNSSSCLEMYIHFKGKKYGENLTMSNWATKN